MIMPNKELQLRRLEAKANESERRTELTKENTPLEVEIEINIRTKYSLSQEIAILRKAHIGELEDGEFEEYSNFVKECIKKAKEEQGV